MAGPGESGDSDEEHTKMLLAMVGARTSLFLAGVHRPFPHCCEIPERINLEGRKAYLGPKFWRLFIKIGQARCYRLL